MVRSSEFPAVSGFSEEFARALCKLVDESPVSRQAIADELQRSRAFVSDQLLGKRPVDTDVISAIAVQFGMSGRMLTRHVLDQLPPDVLGIPGITRPSPVGDLPTAAEERRRRREAMQRPEQEAARDEDEH